MFAFRQEMRQTFKKIFLTCNLVVVLTLCMVWDGMLVVMVVATVGAALTGLGSLFLDTAQGLVKFLLTEVTVLLVRAVATSETEKSQRC